MLFHDFGPPRIDSITRNSANVLISWTARADTQLQSTTNLLQSQWQNVGATSGRNSVTNTITNAATFYRLIRD